MYHDPMLTDFSPMLATKTELIVPKQDGRVSANMAENYIWEPKYDGIRAYAWKGELYSRQGNKITDRFPEIVVPRLDIVLDGEIVFFTDQGFYNPRSFTLCAKRTNKNYHLTYGDAYFVVFDQYNPKTEFARDTLDKRRSGLRRFMEGAELAMMGRTQNRSQQNLRLVDEFDEPGLDLLPIVKNLGYEGVMLKAKRSYYTPGKRSSQWLKYKFVQDGSFIVTGYDEGEGSLTGTVGALHLSVVDGSTIIDVGKVGTGMTLDERNHLLDTINLGEPFVVDVEYQEVGTQGKLRFPSYKGIRTDVQVTDCTKDQLTSKGR